MITQYHYVDTGSLMGEACTAPVPARQRRDRSVNEIRWVSASSVRSSRTARTQKPVTSCDLEGAALITNAPALRQLASAIAAFPIALGVMSRLFRDNLLLITRSSCRNFCKRGILRRLSKPTREMAKAFRASCSMFLVHQIGANPVAIRIGMIGLY